MREMVVGFVKNLLKTSIVALVIPAVAFGAQKENPRGVLSARGVSYSQESGNNTSLRRSVASVIARAVVNGRRQSKNVVVARPAQNQSVKARFARSGAVGGASKSRNAVSKTSFARSGVVANNKSNSKNSSRASAARATAIFNDVTKIGGGYASCRDAYATCMDQMCANANDTYRRCFCSDRFQNFRDASDRLDAALGLLAEFQDNNLNAVDKTAAEVSAMYSASDGEKAIKKDTSASQKLLDNISDVLSGKSVQTQKQSLNSLGVLDFSGFGNNDDIWGEDSFSVFGGDSTNLADLEGKALYDKASKQCAEIISESCGNDAMFNLARSSYSIMISQDCNALEKNINAKRASIEETVRTAEKYLRDARLEEYRKHNSADVNECLTKVETAMRQPVACGENFENCLDYTGQYINTTTGEPIYSQALFGLNSLIVLNGSADVLGANSGFDKFLDGKKMFAATALDSCRDMADTVWYEFKRSALIRIAQAQDEKIQQVKDSCVMTMKECYDTKSDSLNSLDETVSTGAIAAVTARGMCYDRVQACAALYGDPDGCEYNDADKTLKPKNNKKCGLQSLLAFVDTVDSVKVAEGCEAALTKYAHELCDPKVGEEGEYPEGCASMSRTELWAAMEMRRKTFCAYDLVEKDGSNTIMDGEQYATNAFNTNVMNQIIKDIYDKLQIAFVAGCEDDHDVDGVWVSASEFANPSVSMLSQKFYKKYYGVTIANTSQIDSLNLREHGWCLERTSERNACEDLGSYASFDNGQCNLTPEWYEHSCQDILGGTWEYGMCSVDVTPEDY